MSFKRFLFILVIFIIYGLLFADQHMESREQQFEFNTLTKELESLNSRKQELAALITEERSRLIKLSQNMGKRLSAKDIISINEE